MDRCSIVRKLSCTEAERAGKSRQPRPTLINPSRSSSVTSPRRSSFFGTAMTGKPLLEAIEVDVDPGWLRVSEP